MTQIAGPGPASWSELWQGVSEALLGGVHHALNNRLASLSAVAQVLTYGVAGGEAMLASLRDEVERLERTVSLLHLLRRGKERAPEPIVIPELLASLTAILPEHPEMRETEVVVAGDAAVLPAWAERDQLTRVFLTLATLAGAAAERVGVCRLRLEHTGDEAELRVRVETGEGVELPGVEALAEPLREMGGAVREAGGGAWEVRLPTLPEVRRREREGATS